MKAIKKLNIVFGIAMLPLLILLLWFNFKSNLLWGLLIIISLIIATLYRLIFYRKIKKAAFYRNKKVAYTEYSMLSFDHDYYIFGGIFLLCAIMSSYGTIHDLRQGSPIPLWGILMLPGLWIFGILLIYYTYQAKREYSFEGKFIKKLKKK